MHTKEEIIQKITDKARSWVDVPFKHQGRTKAGCDCIAPTLDIVKMLEMHEVQDWPKYGRLPAGPRLYATAQKYMVEIEKDSYEPGDLIFISWGSTDPHHIAIVITMVDGNVGIIHSHSLIGRVVEHILDDKWKNKVICTFRFPIVDKINKRQK